MKATYSLRQIVLHWIIVLLIPIQFLTGGSIERTHHAVHMGMQPDKWDIIQHHIHNYCGIAIGIIMFVRFVVRLWDGVPAQGVARFLQIAFYVAIIGQAGLGFIASYLTFKVAPLHVAGSWIILTMVAIHFTAVVRHAVVLKDGVLDRMSVFSNERADITPGDQ